MMLSSTSFAKVGFAAIAGLIGMGTIAATPQSAQAFSLVKVDFDDLAPDAPLTTQYANQGVTFSLLPGGKSPKPTATAFALASNVYAPAVNMAFTSGSIADQLFSDVSMTFARPINYFSILALDADEPLTARAYYKGTLVDSIQFAAGSDFQVEQVVLGNKNGTTLFDQVVLDVVDGMPGTPIGGPEIFDNLEFNIQSETHSVCR